GGLPAEHAGGVFGVQGLTIIPENHCGKLIEAKGLKAAIQYQRPCEKKKKPRKDKRKKGLGAPKRLTIRPIKHKKLTKRPVHRTVRHRAPRNWKKNWTRSTTNTCGCIP